MTNDAATVAEGIEPRDAMWFRWCGCVLIVALAGARCLMLIVERIAFDVDPAVIPAPSGALGPGGSVLMDVGTLLGALCVFIGCMRGKSGICLWMIALSLLPVPLVLFHAHDDIGDAMVGVSWMSSIIGAVALAHAVREERLRSMAIVLLLAILAPLLVRGLTSVTIEHDLKMEEFRHYKKQLFADRGWTESSPSAKVYERRLRQRQPQGWFISPNIFASFMIVGMLVFVGWSIGSRDGNRWIVLCGLMMAGLCAGQIWMTGSKGAIGTAAIGIAILLARAKWRGAWWPLLALACVVMMLVAIVARGVLLPEDFAGDRSLLFRWHYLTSALAGLRDSLFSGAGPDHFQDVAMLHRHPRCPEEVTSAHSVFVDWTSGLGLIALCWVLLTMSMIARAAGLGDRDDDATTTCAPDRRGIPKLEAGAILFATFASVLFPFLLEQELLSTNVLFMRLAGVVAFVLAAAVLLEWLPRVGGRWLNASLLASGVALLMHGQIEMTFTQPAAAAWCLALLAVLVPAPKGTVKLSWITPLVVGVLVIVTFIMAAKPAWTIERGMLRAARELWPLASAQHVGVADINDRRVRAAEILIQTYDDAPVSDLPLLAASNQYILAAQRSRPEDRYNLALDAYDKAIFAAEEQATTSAIVQAIITAQRLYSLEPDAELADDIIFHSAWLTRRDPLGAASLKRHGDALWDLDRLDDAVDAYRRALVCSFNHELDPLKQLTKADLARLSLRIDAVRAPDPDDWE